MVTGQTRLGTLAVSFDLLVSQEDGALLTVLSLRPLRLGQKVNVFLPSLWSLNLGVTPDEGRLEETHCGFIVIFAEWSTGALSLVEILYSHWSRSSRHYKDF